MLTHIENSGYIEDYEQIGSARQRYEELKEGFCEILGPVTENELGSMWPLENSFFTLDYAEVNDSFGLRTHVTMSFIVPRWMDNLSNKKNYCQ
jgi:hypothetical protein